MLLDWLRFTLPLGSACNDSELMRRGEQTFTSFLHSWQKSLVCVQEGHQTGQARGHHQNWISFTIYWAQSRSPRSKLDSSENLRIINFTSASFSTGRTATFQSFQTVTQLMRVILFYICQAISVDWQEKADRAVIFRRSIHSLII